VLALARRASGARGPPRCRPPTVRSWVESGCGPVWVRVGSGSNNARSCCTRIAAWCTRGLRKRGRGRTSSWGGHPTISTGTDYSFGATMARISELFKAKSQWKAPTNGSWQTFRRRWCLTATTRERRWSQSVAVLIGPWRWLGAKRPPWSGRLSGTPDGGDSNPDHRSRKTREPVLSRQRIAEVSSGSLAFRANLRFRARSHSSKQRVPRPRVPMSRVPVSSQKV